ncbi:hypothetical protein FJY71_07860, partial [candidate division WOR-3 bacterium]|nr:hypothetical protein [candidate division WOR-3 bacterium]
MSQLYHRERRAGAWQGIDQLTFREQSMVYGVGLAADGFGSVHALWYEYDRVAGNGDPFYARCMFEVGRDVGVRAVLSPERVAIPRPAAVVPAAVAKNLGTQFQTGVPVVCTVFGTGRAVRHAAAAVSGALPPGGIDTVEFGSWVPLPAEAWCVRVSTALAGDERPENDAAEARVLPVEVRTAGAPDAYGMCWVDSDAPTGPEFRWRDITGSGTPVPFPTYDDDCARVPIGFRFNWYGEAFESVYVSTNGVLSFECWWEDYENGALPDERGRAVYVLWDDVHCLGPGRVKYRTVGVAPHETLVVSWDSVRFFGYGDSSLSFQALLVEGEDDAVCQYRDVVTGYWRGDRGMGATLGVEGDRARYREYLQYVYGFETSADPYGNLLVSPRAVRYYGLNRPAPGWSEVEPMPASPLGKGVKDGGWLALDPAGMVYAARGNKTPDFFVYDPAGNANGVWTALPAWPDGPEGRPPYRGAAAVCDNSGHVYAVKGNSTLGFWRFCPDSAVWVRLADVPLGASGKKVKGGTDLACVVENGTGYVYLLKGPETDFVRFNAASGTWDEDLPPAPAGTRPKWDRGSWLVYDGERTLYAHKAKYHELWTFDVPTHSWAAQALPGMPLVGRAGKSKKSKDGGSAAYHGGSIFALKGGNTQEFWRRGGER